MMSPYSTTFWPSWWLPHASSAANRRPSIVRTYRLTSLAVAYLCTERARAVAWRRNLQVGVQSRQQCPGLLERSVVLGCGRDESGAGAAFRGVLGRRAQRG